MYLLDTNIWLERLLNRAKANEVKQFLDTFPSFELALSDFTLHSIGVILGRSQKLALLDQFITDLFIQGQVMILSVAAGDTKCVIAAMQSQRLDFDDAYQYVIAKRENLEFVSFDTDFDHTDLKRLPPAQIFAALPPPPAN